MSSANPALTPNTKTVIDRPVWEKVVETFSDDLYARKHCQWGQLLAGAIVSDELKTPNFGL